jgi:uncharacterized protein
MTDNEVSTAEGFEVQVVDNPQALPADQWDALLATQESPTPFLSYAYLSALHESGSAVAQTGWQAAFVLLRKNGVLQAACALYLKSHSYGEYVFDWAWADAYRRNGLRYYPKLLGAVPFTPVPGTRLLASSPQWRERLVHAIGALTQTQKLSSAHLLFLDPTDRSAFAQAGWLMREGVQFHWTQDPSNPVVDFTDLLSRLQRDKRKKIQQERRRVAELGVTFTAYEGAAISTELWDFFYRCYTLTYQAHHSTPYLSRDFFVRMQNSMASNWVMFVGQRADVPVAVSLVAIDAQRRAAWGRYWGCTEPLPNVHFEACYYQPLAWCIAHGYQRFEGGAQGEHKMARGLMPTPTYSAHWLRDERFAAAVADFLQAESAGIEQYVDELRERSPFKASTTESGG